MKGKSFYSYSRSLTVAALIVVLATLVWAKGIAPPVRTTAMPNCLQSAVRDAKAAGEEHIPEAVRRQVRQMLKFGKYRATGRRKPASEFLLRAALGDSFPLINGPVDVNNAISLASGYPGSLFDAAITGPELLVRRGNPGEAYVFNASG